MSGREERGGSDITPEGETLIAPTRGCVSDESGASRERKSAGACVRVGGLLHGDAPIALSAWAKSKLPGQVTRIHDHMTWCAFGVIQGVEHEDLFDADLNLIGAGDNHVGDVSGFAPPGDIHRVHNTADTTAISIHVYGTDVTRIGSSVRRYYD